MQTMNCGRCGQEVAAGGVACARCNAPINPQGGEPPPSAPSPPPTTSSPVDGSIRTQFLRPFITTCIVTGLGMALGIAIALLCTPAQRTDLVATVGLTVISPPQPAATLITSIFLHNLTIALLMLGGGLWLRLLPHFVICVNALFVGAVLTISAHWMSLGRVLLAIAPHGVFEEPAFLLAGTLSIAGAAWKRRTQSVPVRPEELRRVGKYFWIVAGLLLVAATIEGVNINRADHPLLEQPKPSLEAIPNTEWEDLTDASAFGRPGSKGDPVRLNATNQRTDAAYLGAEHHHAVGFSASIRVSPSAKATAGLLFDEGNRLAYVAPTTGYVVAARLDQGRWAVEQQRYYGRKYTLEITVLLAGGQLVYAVDGHELLRHPTSLTELRTVGLSVSDTSAEFDHIRVCKAK
jgi:uncharacterized membrane protein SpoIIM required for sporulation